MQMLKYIRSSIFITKLVSFSNWIFC